MDDNQNDDLRASQNDGEYEDPQDQNTLADQNQDFDDQDQNQDQDDSQDASQKPEGAEGGKGKTDRGTNVAKEPESQYYQQLKNENSDMRRLLSNPTGIKEYLRSLEGTAAPEQGKDDDMADLAEKVMTEDGRVDVGKLAKYMEERLMSKWEKGMEYNLQNMQRSQEMGRAYDEEKGSVRKAHPELDPTSDKYDKDLEDFVGERFIAQGGLEGRVSLRQVVDQTFGYLEKVRGTGKNQGRAEAETEIVRKKVGGIDRQRIPANPKESEDNMSAEEVLAKRVRLAMQGGRR